jgi:hypothetical protein
VHSALLWHQTFHERGTRIVAAPEHIAGKYPQTTGQRRIVGKRIGALLGVDPGISAIAREPQEAIAGCEERAAHGVIADIVETNI